MIDRSFFLSHFRFQMRKHRRSNYLTQTHLRFGLFCILSCLSWESLLRSASFGQHSTDTENIARSGYHAVRGILNLYYITRAVEQRVSGSVGNLMKQRSINILQSFENAIHRNIASLHSSGISASQTSSKI